jgi:hypothetical protein
MRAIVIKESLRDGELPASFYGTGVREYRYSLDEETVITITEVAVDEPRALDVAMALSRMLLPRLYYAHLIGDHGMYISFPNCVVRLDRGDEEGQRDAQAVGRIFDIPLSQMRFLEMFETDHPDTPGQDL